MRLLVCGALLGVILANCSGGEFRAQVDAGPDVSTLPAVGDAASDGSSEAMPEASQDAQTEDAQADVSEDVEAEVDAGCMALMAGCECLSGRCGPGLGCVDNLCVIMPDPIAHWPFSGSARDASGNGFDGRTVNGVTFTATTAVFDGEDSFVEIDAFAARFKQIWGRFTLHIRFKAMSYAGDPLLFGLGDVGDSQATNGWWFMTATSTGEAGTETRTAIVTETGDGMDNVHPLGGVLPLEEWLDVTFVISGNQVRYYEGGSIATTEFFERADTAANRMQIGGWIEPENVLLGEIDDVRVFDAELSQTQIRALPSITD